MNSYNFLQLTKKVEFVSNSNIQNNQRLKKIIFFFKRGMFTRGIVGNGGDGNGNRNLVIRNENLKPIEKKNNKEEKEGEVSSDSFVEDFNNTIEIEDNDLIGTTSTINIEENKVLYLQSQNTTVSHYGITFLIDFIQTNNSVLAFIFFYKCTSIIEYVRNFFELIRGGSTTRLSSALTEQESTTNTRSPTKMTADIADLYKEVEKIEILTQEVSDELKKIEDLQNSIDECMKKQVNIGSLPFRIIYLKIYRVVLSGVFLIIKILKKGLR